MSSSAQAVEFLEVNRYTRPDTPPERWEISGSDGQWCAVGPAGRLSRSFPDPVAALIASGSCAFAPGVALRIQTRGTVDAFALFPALEEWLVEPSPGSEGGSAQAEPSVWSFHPDFAYLEEISSEDYEALYLDSSRIILIDDDLCGVCSALIGSGPTAIRKRIFVLAEWEMMGDLTPKFLDLWATMSTGNGYGWGEHAIGEVSPGVRAVVDNDEGMRSVFFDSLPSPDELYSEVLAWISGCVSSTPNPGTGEGFSEFEVVIDGSDVQVVFPDDAPYVEASGWIAPAVSDRRSPS